MRLGRFWSQAREVCSFPREPKKKTNQIKADLRFKDYNLCKQNYMKLLFSVLDTVNLKIIQPHYESILGWFDLMLLPVHLPGFVDRSSVEAGDCGHCSGRSGVGGTSGYQTIQQ